MTIIIIFLVFIIGFYIYQYYFSEKAIMNTLFEVTKNVTTIIVAHRLSTIKNCNQIVVFDKGEVVEVGSHQELMNKNSAYKKLWEAQNNE